MLKILVRHHKFVFGLLTGVVMGMTLSPLTLMWDPDNQVQYIQRKQELLSSQKSRFYTRDQFKLPDDTSVADKLFHKVKVMCWVMTSEENLRRKADHVMATWGKRCNKILFAADGNDSLLPVMQFDIKQGRGHLTAKTMNAFNYSFNHHLDDFDWFLKTDDDSFIILENLRYFLSSQNTSEPVIFGHHFDMFVDQGYMSGGAGYVISREALRRFGHKIYGQCPNDGGDEDVMFGKCMESLEVTPGDSRDSLGRSRFHCFHPETFIIGDFPEWYKRHEKYGALKGINAMSDYVISFHYLPPKMLYIMEYFIYHVKLYGIQRQDQTLNGPVNETYIVNISHHPIPPHLEVKSKGNVTKSPSVVSTKLIKKN